MSLEVGMVARGGIEPPTRGFSAQTEAEPAAPGAIESST